MKSYTDLNQSRKLAKILPLDSADMSYRPYREEGGIPDYHADLCPYNFASWIGVPCWSLAALLSVIHDVSLNSFKDGRDWNVMIQHDGRMVYVDKENPVDACVELITTLHKQKLL